VSKVPQNFPLCENPNAGKTKTESHGYTHLICTQWNFNFQKNTSNLYTAFLQTAHRLQNNVLCLWSWGPIFNWFRKILWKT